MPRFELSKGTSNKFWEIELQGSAYTITYGAIGAAGKSLRKEFGSEAEARAQYEKQLAGKLREGYAPAGSPEAAAPTAPADTVPAGPVARGDLKDGESVEVQGSGSRRYTLKNTGGVYSCNCPAWRNQSLGIEKRTCKHIVALRGAEAEEKRVGEATGRKIQETPAGEPKKVPPLLLAETWKNDVDLAGWWISEKLDGVRAYWDGTQLISRLGNAYLAPEWFTAVLPALPLDGELWCGRKRFQQTVSIVRRQDRTELWREVKFLVFDAPAHPGPFEERFELLRRSLQEPGQAHVQPHEHQRCEGLEHLRAELARVEGLGGEGLMLRRPGSAYEVGRSGTLLKVKSFLDAEARVLEHVAGAGRHKGRMGALRVELADGTQFSVGTGFTDAERQDPPPVGSLITFRYQELSEAGVPRFPAYLGLRLDAEP